VIICLNGKKETFEEKEGKEVIARLFVWKHLKIRKGKKSTKEVNFLYQLFL